MKKVIKLKRFSSFSLKFDLKVKLTTFLLIVTLFQLQASNGYSQKTKITLNLENVSVENVLNKIESLTDFKFFYNDKEVDYDKIVSIKAKREFISSILKKLFANSNIKFEISDKQIILKNKKITSSNLNKQSSTIKIQQREIKGTVTDDNDQPLPGATIIVKGTNSGTTTDFDGKFTISIPDGATTLIVSYIGFGTQEVFIDNQDVININLISKASGLDEIVVVGYGTIKKENLTGAVDQINADELGYRPSSSIITSLQGLMPGLSIQSSNGDPRIPTEINVRGFNSINGGGPLVLVDGIEGNLDILNPLDIESITVLKDAASAAIYGARGAFGIILVTTKKGVVGDVKINYSSNLGFTSPVARTDYISDPVKYGRTIDAAINGYNGTNYTRYTSDEDWDRLQQVANGTVAPWQELQADGTFKFYNSTDWHKYLFKKVTVSKIHNISISGGTDKLKAYFSGRYYNTETIQKIRDEDINKYNIKTNVSLKVNDWLEIFENIQYNTGDQIEYGGRAAGWGTNWIYANNFLLAFHPTNIDGVPFDNAGQSTHAAIEEGNNFETYAYKEFINTISAKLTPFDGLVVNLDYSNRFTNSTAKRRLNEFQYLTGSRAELRTVGINRLTETHKEKVFNAMNLYATYAKTFADDHNFKLMVGYNQEDFDEEEVIAEQGGLFNPDFSNLNLGTEILRADGASETWAVQGYFGRFNYNFKDRYLLEISARYDGSSRFPKESRWGFFPSASAGWVVSRESFWEPIKDVVSSLKFRGSYGRLGNQNVPLYTFSQLLDIGQSDWVTDGALLNFVGAPNPLPSVVTWEKTAITNLGLDFGLLKNKLTASIDWFGKKITDMYLPGEPQPGVFGSSSPRENIADLEVKGFELTLAYRNSFKLKGSQFNLKATLSVNNSVGRIIKYPNPEGLLSNFYEGQKLGEIWGYRVDGQFQSDEEAAAYQNSFTTPTSDLGQVYNFAINVAQNNEWKGLRAGDLKYLDLNGDGEISKGNNTLEDHGDLEVIGNSMPRFPFGFSFSADWKGFDLMLAGAGVASQDWYPRGRLFWGTYERPYVAFIRKDLVANAWSPENPSGKFPQISRGYTALSSNRQLSAVNDHFLTNVGYLRVKNLTLGYTLPQDVTKKFKIDRIRLYLSGENLFTFRFGGLTKYLDPEQAGSGVSFNDPNGATTRSRVEDYPIGQTYSFGINITL